MNNEELPVEVMFWNGIKALLFGTQSKFLFVSTDAAEDFIKSFHCKKECTEISITVYDKNNVIEHFLYEVIEDDVEKIEN